MFREIGYNYTIKMGQNMKKRLKIIITASAGMFLLSGCIHRELLIPNIGTLTESNTTRSNAPIPRVPFPADEYARLKKSGSSTVAGKIYLTNADGQRIYGRHTRLYLNPVTSYSKQWFEESYIGGHKMAKTDKRLYNYLKFTASDSKGRFAFYGVPAGSYYAIGTVRCAKECGYSTPKTIRVAKEITVGSGETKRVDLGKPVYN